MDRQKQKRCSPTLGIRLSLSSTVCYKELLGVDIQPWALTLFCSYVHARAWISIPSVDVQALVWMSTPQHGCPSPGGTLEKNNVHTWPWISTPGDGYPSRRVDVHAQQFFITDCSTSHQMLVLWILITDSFTLQFAEDTRVLREIVYEKDVEKLQADFDKGKNMLLSVKHLKFCDKEQLSIWKNPLLASLQSMMILFDERLKKEPFHHPEKLRENSNHVKKNAITRSL